MKKYLIPILAFLLASCSITRRDEPVIHHNDRSLLSVDDPQYQTAYSESYYSGSPEEDELEGVQCPIPMSDRVRNYTGVQCVFSSSGNDWSLGRMQATDATADHKPERL
jgi:outer membrane PBP1 activator LpoA protein